jgi:hypothetical protein
MGKRKRSIELQADVLRLLREGTAIAARAERLGLADVEQHLFNATLELGNAAFKLGLIVTKPVEGAPTQESLDLGDDLPF